MSVDPVCVTPQQAIQKYIPDAGHPSRFVSRTWRRDLVHAGTSHDVLIYTVQIRLARTPHPMLANWTMNWNWKTAYESLVDGEWASPDGYRSYDSYEDAVAAAQDAVRRMIVTDPLESLYRPSSPADPRPSFAAQLRRQVADELREETMTEVQTTITPVLSVSDARRAIQFYKEAFGATEVYVETVPDGSVYAAVAIGPATVEITSESSDQGNLGPLALGGTPVRLSLIVPDPDAVAERAVAAGARVIFPIADQPYGYRQGRIEDPFGHQWMIGRPLDST